MALRQYLYALRAGPTGIAQSREARLHMRCAQVPRASRRAAKPDHVAALRAEGRRS